VKPTTAWPISVLSSGIPSFVGPWLGCVCYIAVVIMWLIPDSRIEKKVRAME
jgi:hypothetical protein